ncbi:hypothetical protein RDI58_013161 [Solanum bulbocastanum]|uniref:Uncharacterized protein n=1 Tax=Solanum bulbocastanum TaxID=147425 RepID=A0AAN8TQ66_SOLBU
MSREEIHEAYDDRSHSYQIRSLFKEKACLISWMDQQLSQMKTTKNKFVISWILNSVNANVALNLRPFNMSAEM